MKEKRFLTVRGTTCSNKVREQEDSGGKPDKSIVFMLDREPGRTNVAVLGGEPGTTSFAVLEGEDTTYNQNHKI
jgi:hypothetical protein